MKSRIILSTSSAVAVLAALSLHASAKELQRYSPPGHGISVAIPGEPWQMELGQGFDLLTLRRTGASAAPRELMPEISIRWSLKAERSGEAWHYYQTERSLVPLKGLSYSAKKGVLHYNIDCVSPQSDFESLEWTCRRLAEGIDFVPVAHRPWRFPDEKGMEKARYLLRQWGTAKWMQEREKFSLRLQSAPHDLDIYLALTAQAVVDAVMGPADIGMLAQADLMVSGLRQIAPEFYWNDWMDSLLAFAQGRQEQALQGVKRALGKDPASWESYLAYSVILEDKPSMALQMADRAAAIEEGPLVWARLVRLNLSLGKEDIASTWLEKWRHKQPKSFAAWRETARTAIDRQEGDEARQAFKKMERLASSPGETLVLQEMSASLYAREGQFGEAIRTYESMLNRCRQGCDDRRLTLARLYARGGRVLEAEEMLRKALKENQRNADIHYALGELALKYKRDRTSAVIHFRTYLSLVPNGPDSEKLQQLIDRMTQEIIAEKRRAHPPSSMMEEER